MAVDAIDGDFIPIALASGCSCIAIKRYKLGEGRSYEWVNIDVLKTEMSKIFQQSITLHDHCYWPNWEIDCLLALIGITGTDYSRGLPLIKAKKIWILLPKLLSTLFNGCIHLVNNHPTLLPDVAADLLYSSIYVNVFKSHVTQTSTLENVLKSLKSSKLSQKSKSSLPSYQRARCTIKNVNFILAYWNGLAPNSMDPQYGFKLNEGVVEWNDE
jgi:hypothetical protein